MKGLTVHAKLPGLPHRNCRPRSSRYEDALQLADQYEGSWIRLDQLRQDAKARAMSVAKGAHSAGRARTKRLGYVTGYQTAVREVDGHWYAYLRKRTRSEARP